MSRRFLYLGACSEAIMSVPGYMRPLEGYIERNSAEDVLLHVKARMLEAEGYIADWAAEINDDYFKGELEFKLRWSHRMVARAGFSQGSVDYHRGKVVANGEVVISYLLAEHAYTDNEDVVEYLLMHEIAHQVQMNHSYAFWAIVRQNPRAISGFVKYHGRDFPIGTALEERSPYFTRW